MIYVVNDLQKCSQNSILQTHMYSGIHTGDKHYKYDVCSERFSQNGSLQEHITVIPTFHCVVFLPCLANVEIQDNQ